MTIEPRAHIKGLIGPLIRTVVGNEKSEAIQEAINPNQRGHKMLFSFNFGDV